MEQIANDVESQLPLQLPAHIREFLEKTVVLAKEYGCAQFSIEMRFSPWMLRRKVDDAILRDWINTFRASWHAGRHGEPAPVHFSTTIDVHGEV